MVDSASSGGRDEHMVWQNMWQVAKSDYLKLLPILMLAFYIAFIPHQNYPYLVHIDEWVHLANAKAMLQAGDATFLDPFSGQSPVGLTTCCQSTKWDTFNTEDFVIIRRR